MTVATRKKPSKAEPEGGQKELPGMPPKGKSQLRAEELVEALEVVSEKKANAETCCNQLISQMKADKQISTACKSATGVTYRFTLEESAKLRVKKERIKKKRK